ncbi:MAG: 4'-phosphopantetheinyl transferase family protein [Ruminococcus sp.]
MKVYACFFKNADFRKQHENAHKLLCFALKREYGIEEYTLGKKSLGKPFLNEYSDIFINLSHCSGLAVCAAGRRALGVDCEGIREVRSGVVRRVCTDSEALEIKNADNPDLAFTRLWTLKESFVKAVGRGISYPMKNAAFSLAGDAIYTNVRGVEFCQWVIADRYVISLCAAMQAGEISLEFVREKELEKE